jgi:NCS2 family nucleobase:cation symporter-2
MNETQQLKYGINDKPSFFKSLLLGLQHVLSMDLYVMPLVLGGILGMATGQLANFIQISFVACGIGTLIQTLLGIRLPVVQGPAYVTLGTLTAIGATKGLGVMLGSLIPAAILIILIGVFHLYANFMKKIITPFMGGVILLIIGISITPTAINGIFSTKGDLGINIASGLLAIVVLLVTTVYQYSRKGKGDLLNSSSVIIAIIVSTLFVAIMGKANFNAVASASWVHIPHFVPFGLQFDLSSCILMCLTFLVLLVDTTSTWIAVSDITAVNLTHQRLNRAVIGEGVSCLISGILGSTPVTGYSSNVGVLAITKCGSRKVVAFAGGILIILGFVPKLSSIITSVPLPVINGVFLMMCLILIAKGITTIQNANENMDGRNSIIVSLSVAITIMAIILPSDVVKQMPQMVQYFITSSTAMGALSAILLQLILPGRQSYSAEAIRKKVSTID